MVNKIQLDIISDIVCPWCIIGYKRLISAILELNLEKKLKSYGTLLKLIQICQKKVKT